ncbi:MAG: DUF512 domain-containing protein [Clostridium sp.]|uniref:DUF512 domain-containing protein n=1 Tax=Clostridium sp. TaxID=1506 RepID=UPI003EE4CCC6
MKNMIKEVLPESIAEEVGIEVGDFLLSINDKDIDDIIDYRFLSVDDELTLQIEKADGEVWDIEIEKEPGEELGLEFGGGIMDKAKSCTNKCIFCFIDQNPKGMRETIYFKDDDSRLSFLQGNFVTLTNMKDEDIDRIIKYHISPINISVHTTNPELRREMLNNRFAGAVYERMERLAKEGIHMHAQIVCIPDINNGEELKRTIRDLYNLYPYVNNVAVVPIGMTKFRENLKKLRRFTKEESIDTINFIKQMQDDFYKEVGEPFVRLSDEFYVVAGIDVPDANFYDGYSQIEDGVGSIRYFRNRIMEDLKDLDLTKGGDYTSVTGALAYEEVKSVMNKITEKNSKIKIDVREIINNFYGDTITVSGLITGRDIIEQLKGKIQTKYLIMPDNMFRRGYEPGSSEVPVMLDDTVIADIEKALDVEVIVCDYSGDDLISLLNKHNEEE